MTWGAAENMYLTNQPLLMMAGIKADTKYMTSDALGKATGTRKKELYLIDGVNAHISILASTIR
jgi:hypothetical protein